MLHTLFLRFHNQIATSLQSSYKNQETIFQETRRIVGAVMQKITYDEYLASFLSDEAMEIHGLKSTATYSYDTNLDPSVSAEFGIGYRYGTSELTGPYSPTFQA